MRDKMKMFKQIYLEEMNSPDVKNKIKTEIKVKKVGEEKNNINPKLKWRTPLIAGLSFVLVAVITVVITISVINYRNTPTYQGMDASNIIVDDENNVNYKPNKETGNKLFRRHTVDEGVEEEIIDQIGIVLQDGIVCYVKPNEEVIITVNIDNPKFYEILSFTLNGRLYQSYEFVEGSNSTQILVKFTCQETSGIQVITIDAIKYVDDTTIKNARFEADKTINLGVTYQNVPNISSVSEIVDTTNFGVSFVANDEDHIIDVETGLNIYLFDDGKLVQTTKLVLGRNVIPYSNLRMGSTYTYIIIGTFDLFDGIGKKGYVLHQQSFTTKEGFTYNSVESEYDSININYNTVDITNGELSVIDLYLGDEYISSIDPKTTKDYSFKDLLSNTNYRINTSYTYHIIENEVDVEVTKEISFDVMTKERPIPTVNLTSTSIGQENIDLVTEIVDTTTVGKIIKLDLYKGEEIVQTFAEFKEQLVDLLSNNQYKIIITYEYDLLDNTEKKTLTAEYSFTTLAKTTPSVSLETKGLDQTSIIFDYEITDIDNICIVKSIELYHKDITVKSAENLEVREFTDLLSNNNYKIKVNFEYDLNDGEGIQSSFSEITIKTVAKTVPTAVFTSAVPFGAMIVVWAEMNDIDEVMTIEKIEVYKDNELILTELLFDNLNKEENGKSTADITFNSLTSGEYTVVIVYSYDLNDGEGSHVVDKNHPTADNKIGVTIE